ncbi:MAG: TonB-dependent receptor domain-containing protein [Gemmatimonadaceae bacterium]
MLLTTNILIMPRAVSMTIRVSSHMRRVTARLTAAVAIIGALSAATSGPVNAQGTTTGAIRGRVVDETGNPLAAAQVIAVNEGTTFTRSALALDDGSYTIRLLPPGSYRVTARRIGHQQQEIPNVRVIVGSATPQNFTLRVAAVTLGAVEVRASAQAIDVTDGGVKQTVGETEIDNLPALGRDFTDFINLSGLVSPTPETTTGGQFSIAGQRPSQTSIQIDGVDANNSFFGENRGGSRIPFAFSLESIREFQIITNGYDVEYGNYSGGIVNIVTKGGTNAFHGSAYGNLRDDALTGENFDGTEPNKYSVQQYAAQLEGPVIKDKLFYMLSLDGQRRREPFRSVSPASLRGSGTASDAALADSLEAYFDVLETTYGVTGARDTYGEWQISNDVLTLFGRLDWNLGDRHRLSLRNNYSNHRNLDEAGTFAINSGRSQAESLRDRANSLVGELTSVLHPKVFNVLRMQYATEERPRVGNELRPEMAVRLAPDLTVEYGGSFISFNNNLIEDKLQIVDNVTLDAGAHSIKLGTNNTFSSFRNNFWFNGSGAYFFSSLEDFRQQNPSRYVRNVRLDGQPPTAVFDAQEYSVYAQDDWQITPRVLASAGLRYDVARYGDRPGRVIDVERAFGFETGVAPIDKNNVSPRAAVTFDMNGDATSVLRAGAGLFYGRVPFVLGSNVGITDVPLRSLDCRGSIEDGDPNAPPVVDYGSLPANGSGNPFNCAGAAGVGGVPEYTFWEGGFEIPETFKANAGYERRLTSTTRAKLDLIYSRSSKLYTVRNINLRDPQFSVDGEGGRRIFVPESSFDPTSAAGSNRLRNTDFGNLLVNYNDGLAESFSATLDVDHRLSDDFHVRGSYTYTTSEDNSSYSCCTANEGFTGQRYGALGPNVIGSAGDESAGWGPSNFVRNHTFVFSGFVTIPYVAVKLTGIFRAQSGSPWGPEVSGDINADGVRFNDRPFIFAPEDLPVSVSPTATNPDSVIAANRESYARYLSDNDCVGDYVGQIIPRNTCRQPWFNRLDISLRRDFPTVSDQRLELSVDLFNVLNGLNKKWGRYESVQTSNRNLLVAQSYDETTGQVLYTVPTPGATGFGGKRTTGSNLLLQFSMQVGLRYRF